MTGKVIRDYLSAYRWENMKKSVKSSQIWCPIYLAFICPINTNFYESVRSGLLYLSLVIPVLWEILELQLCPMGLTKLQYLCPMDERDRKAYLWEMYFLKVFVPVFFCMGVRLLFLLVGWLVPWNLLLEMLLFVCFSLALQLQPVAWPPNRAHPLWNMMRWCNAGRIFGCLFLIVSVCVDMESGGWQSVWLHAAAGTALTVQVLLTFKIMSYRKLIGEFLMDYENTVKMQQKSCK